MQFPDLLYVTESECKGSYDGLDAISQHHIQEGLQVAQYRLVAVGKVVNSPSFNPSKKTVPDKGIVPEGMSIAQLIDFFHRNGLPKEGVFVRLSGIISGVPGALILEPDPVLAVATGDRLNKKSTSFALELRRSYKVNSDTPILVNPTRSGPGWACVVISSVEYNEVDRLVTLYTKMVY